MLRQLLPQGRLFGQRSKRCERPLLGDMHAVYSVANSATQESLSDIDDEPMGGQTEYPQMVAKARPHAIQPTGSSRFASGSDERTTFVCSIGRSPAPWSLAPIDTPNAKDALAARGARVRHSSARPTSLPPQPSTRLGLADTRIGEEKVSKPRTIC